MSVSVKPMEKANAHKLLYVNFSTTDSCAQSSSSALRFEIDSPKQSQKFWWVYICLCKVLMWHIHPQNACRNKHTWGKIHIPSWSKIITALTGLSGPHILPPLQLLIWYDIWIRWCHVHIFRVEAGLCLLSHRVTTGEMMTCSPCSLITIARHLHRERCAISTTYLISRSAGICILGLDWWMNHFLSSPPLKTRCVQRLGLWRTSNTDTGVKGGDYRHSAVMNIWKASSGRNMLRERKMYLWWMSSKMFFLWLMQVYRHYLKKDDNLTL